MTTTDENRPYAQESARFVAGETADLDHRQIMLAMALAWARLAVQDNDADLSDLIRATEIMR
jgi:hypothetical protein